ncbi:MAG TPA: hypothetical protein VKT51_08560 [Candidatus Eremiobacteraceae bacterium]|nr:hypothetical protein [Candidatus Eremiobacteraceae bacterium]
MHTYTWSAARQRRDAFLAEADSRRLARLAGRRGYPARRRIAGWLVELGYFVVDAGMRLDRGRHAKTKSGARLHPVQ